jgi:WD40 repeat protein
MRLWRIDGSRVTEIRTEPTHIGRVSTLSFSRDGRTLASAGESEVKLWNAEPFRQLGSFTTHPSSIRVLVLSPDGSTVATSRSDWKAEVWDCTSGKRLALFDGHKQGVPGLALSRHGDTLVTASDDATAKLWDVKGPREKAKLEGQMFALKSAALSSDDQRLALGGSDSTIKIWDLASKRPLATLKGHKGEGTGGEVRAVAFLADGNTLVSVSDKSLAVWRAATLAETAAKTK